MNNSVLLTMSHALPTMCYDVGLAVIMFVLLQLMLAYSMCYSVDLVLFDL